MQQLAQRLFFPMLLSFSLSGIGVFLIYIINKKNEERKKRIKKKDAPPVLDDAKFRHSKECLVNSRSLPAIIGRGGKEILRIESTTNTRILFKEEIDYKTDKRIAVISGESHNIDLAIKEIKKIENSEPIIELHEYMVPVRTIKKLLKNNEKLLKIMQSTTFAKIIIDRDAITHEMNYDVLKKIIIKGEEKHIQQALIELEKQIKFDEVDEQQAENNASNRVRRIKPSHCLSPSEISYDRDIVLSNGANDKIVQENDLGKPYKVFVCSVEHPKKFYIQVISEKNRQLDVLIDEMITYYENESIRKYHVLKKFEYGKIVAAKFTDGKWYRAQIISVINPKKIELYFSDFGDCDVIDSNDIYELSTEFLHLRFQAQEVSLYGVNPVDGNWNEETIEVFSKLAGEGEWVPRTAINRAWEKRTADPKNVFQLGREGNPIPIIELFDKRGDRFISINKELINKKLVVKDEEAWNLVKLKSTIPKEEKKPRYSARPSNFCQTSLSDLGDLGTENDKFVSHEDSNTPDWMENSEMKTDSSISTDDSGDDGQVEGIEKKKLFETETKENGIKEKAVGKIKKNKERKGATVEDTEKAEAAESTNGKVEEENGHVTQQNIKVVTSGSKKSTYNNYKAREVRPSKKVSFNPFIQEKHIKPINIMPAGFESDLSDDDYNGFDIY